MRMSSVRVKKLVQFDTALVALNATSDPQECMFTSFAISHILCIYFNQTNIHRHTNKEMIENSNVYINIVGLTSVRVKKLVQFDTALVALNATSDPQECIFTSFAHIPANSGKT